MDNLSAEEEKKLPQLIKKFKNNKEYYDFIINRKDIDCLYHSSVINAINKL